MRRFLSRFSFFICFLSVMFIVAFSLLRISQHSLLRLPEGCHIVFLGNSHVEDAVNDSLIQGAYNFARSAERIESLYAKLKMLKRINPQIDTVFIGMDYILMHHGVNEEFSSALVHPYNYMEYDIEDWQWIFGNTSFDYLQSFLAHPISWMKIVDLLKLHNPQVDIRQCSYLGGYLFSNRFNVKEDARRKEEKHPSSFSRVPFNYHFAQKCIDYCAQNNICLYFFTTPYHRDCPFTNRQIQLKNDFKNNNWFDMVSMELPDSCFGNLDHLNYLGAIRFSNQIEKQLLHPERHHNAL